MKLVRKCKQILKKFIKGWYFLCYYKSDVDIEFFYRIRLFILSQHILTASWKRKMFTFCTDFYFYAIFVTFLGVQYFIYNCWNCICLPDRQVKQGVSVWSAWCKLPRIFHQLVDFPPVVFTPGQFDEQEDEVQPGVEHHVKVFKVNLIK